MIITARPLNLLVEDDGDYWHSKPGMTERDERKRQFAIERGYNIERVPESIIMSSDCPEYFASMIARYGGSAPPRQKHLFGLR